MDWSKMVKMTVPVGLCGWQQRGSLTINGRTTEFPVGVETELPEPVAERIKALIDDAEGKAEHVQTLKPWQQFVTGEDGVAHWSDRIDKPGSPHQYLTTDGNGKPHWEDKLAYEDVQVVDVLKDATTEIKYTGPNFNRDGEWLSEVEVGDKGVLYLNGVPYEYTAEYDSTTGTGYIIIRFKLDNGPSSPAIYRYPGPEPAVHALVLIGATGKTYTISITKNVTTIKPLDPKYLPSGSGGGGVIYADLELIMQGSESSVPVAVPAYADAALASQLTYEQGKNTVYQPHVIAACDGGVIAATFTPILTQPDDESKAVSIVIANPALNGMTTYGLVFSDTDL